MFRCLKTAACGAAVLFLAACATPGFQPEMQMADAEINPVTVTEHTLKWLPGPNAQIPVAVYGLADETGAFKPSEGTQTLSRAVTQAPTPILIKALQDAGNRRWFSVIERENLQNLLKERQIITEMRARYLGESELNQDALPALKFAGVLIEGAITGYDTNTVTGGAGARYLGIGASTQYREDAVSIYLRAVSVKTGEVLISITSEQRVASVAVQGNAFRFVAFQELLEAEAGLTMNQPRHLAVRQAIEKAVYGMIVEGAELGLWEFEDQLAGQAAIAHYRSVYAPAYNDKFNDALPPQFFAAEERQRLAAYDQATEQQQARYEAAQQALAARQIEERLASLPPVEPLPVQTSQLTAPEQPAPEQPREAVAEEVSATQPVEAETESARDVASLPAPVPGPQDRDEPEVVEVALMGRSVEDALAAIAAARAEGEPVIITASMAASLAAINRGEASHAPDNSEYARMAASAASVPSSAQQREVTPP